MKLHKLATAPRKGFTLIEILVVIAIIAVLVGMLLVAVFPSLGRGTDVKARKELTQMQEAIAAFQRDRSVDFIPSRLLLKEDGNYAAAPDPVLARDSVLFLKKVFPNARLSSGIDWNGDGTIDKNTFYILDGSQCLVFLLGGINGTQGFSTDPLNPGNIAGRKDKIGPFYSFEAARLILGVNSFNQSNAFPFYNDPYGDGKPYAYFSNYGKENGYNRYGIPGTTGVVSDCGALGVQPYYTSYNKTTGVYTYHNPRSFQIITAGKDNAHGPGGLWNPNSGGTGGGGGDDLSNFYATKLGN